MGIFRADTAVGAAATARAGGHVAAASGRPAAGALAGERVSPDEAASLAHPERAELDLASVLHALSDPMRLRIIADLAESGGERSCSSFDLPIVKSTCTHHFKVLREAGLIRQKVLGTKRVSSLRYEDLNARFPGLLEAVLRGATPIV
jgi:DNA-binding transcriptional ArsR family regulator